jgi:hypothetical protein
MLAFGLVTQWGLANSTRFSGSTKRHVNIPQFQFPVLPVKVVVHVVVLTELTYFIIIIMQEKNEICCKSAKSNYIITVFFSRRMDSWTQVNNSDIHVTK